MRGLDPDTGALVRTLGHGNSTCHQATSHLAKEVKRHLSVNKAQAQYIFIGMSVRVVCEEM